MGNKTMGIQTCHKDFYNDMKKHRFVIIDMGSCFDT